MEGNKMFNYETAEKSKDIKKENDVKEVIVKILQVILGIIMAILHM